MRSSLAACILFALVGVASASEYATYSSASGGGGSSVVNKYTGGRLSPGDAYAKNRDVSVAFSNPMWAGQVTLNAAAAKTIDSFATADAWGKSHGLAENEYGHTKGRSHDYAKAGDGVNAGLSVPVGNTGQAIEVTGLGERAASSAHFTTQASTAHDRWSKSLGGQLSTTTVDHPGFNSVAVGRARAFTSSYEAVDQDSYGRGAEGIEKAARKIYGGAIWEPYWPYAPTDGEIENEN